MKILLNTVSVYQVGKVASILAKLHISPSRKWFVNVVSESTHQTIHNGFQCNATGSPVDPIIFKL